MDEQSAKHILTTNDVEELLWLLEDDHIPELMACLRAILLCGPNARRILAHSADGLVAGRHYGDWTGSRDYAVEALEEYRDAHLYLTHLELQILDRLAAVREARDGSDKSHAMLAIMAGGACA